jgi:hypothetical protein
MVKKIIRIIAFVEIAIGLYTIVGLIASAWFSFPTKPLNVFIFVMISAATSIVLGAGLFNYKEKARMLLIFFSGYVALTKILIFLNLLKLCCEITVLIPVHVKNSVSVIYHFLLIIFFTRPEVKSYFNKK